MLYAAPFNPPIIRQLLRINIGLMVCIEFIMNAMLSFSSSYLCGGLGMTLHTYSLTTAVYAGTAILMIAQHHWLVSHLGYRRFIRCALVFFTVGSLICANADAASLFIFGRVIQAIGGSAFFTAARVHVNFFAPTPAGRGLAIRYMAYSLVGGSAMAAFLAALILEHYSWRALFLIQLPQIAAVWWLTGKTTSNVRKLRPSGKLHPANMFCLVAGVFVLQYIVENAPYDYFSDESLFCGLLLLAIIGLGLFVWFEHQRHYSLLSFRHFFSSRYLAGLMIYVLCYLVIASTNYLIPIFLQKGLSFPVLNCGALLTTTSLCSLIFAWLHLKVSAKYSNQKHYLLFAFACLSIFGLLSSHLSSGIRLWDMAIPLIFLSGFAAVGQGTAAFNTFRETDSRLFSQAYQTKNMLRELMNSTAVSLTNVFLQTREAEHYTRLAENVNERTVAHYSVSISQLYNLATQQSVVMSCLDAFWGIGVAGGLFFIFSWWQKKIV
ncbi:MFS transporter [uncultured Tolumonas sp.]|uniref:MFS transporter n=1 Tax=uncultured Tolumonas sp. TaxID=263765 RepID=UPI0029313BC4|nr:MFS transporter [uncultured Tolumonas sp.]